MPAPSPLPLPDPPLTDGAVTLRPWRAADLATLVTAGGDPLVHRFRHSLPDGPEQARAWLEQTDAARLRGDRLELAITDEDKPEQALGSVSVWGFHRRNRTALVSYWLLEAGRGRGRAATAVTLTAGWAWQTRLRPAAWRRISRHAAAAAAIPAVAGASR
jgi:RimJ/RimL family protein N-acetyltransferase